MYGTFWALIPPVIAIVLALVTKDVYMSMLMGILTGALLSTGFSPVRALDLIIVDGFSASVAALAGNFCFLVFLGALVHLIDRSGGSKAFGNWTCRHIRSRSGVQAAAFGLGILIFIDDYFNCLTVGAVMRPATDRAKVSRAKLAYLVDATAAPICMIAPVSSWTAAVAGVANDLGTGISGTMLFIRTIPYNFYSLLTLVFVISLIVMKFDYGKMATAEEAASGGASTDPPLVHDGQENEAGPKGSTFDLVLPVLVLIAAVFFCMLYAGGYYGSTPWLQSDNSGNIIGALGDTDAFIALPMGSFIALLFTFVYYMLRRILDFRSMALCIPEGFYSMIPSILILTLAMTLKTIISSLGADVFIHEVMSNASAGLTGLLPAVIFLAAVVFSFSTGTSWGSFGILIPIVTAIFSADDSLLIIGVSACLAGSVCGDHCSPISDTTIMASAGAQIDHVEHVTTQLPYALTVAGVSFAVYLLAGAVHNSLICLAAGSILTVAVLALIKARTKH